jgi:hypothetical protein
MNCQMCHQEGLSWAKKLAQVWGRPLRCDICGARHYLSVFDQPLSEEESGCYSTLVEWVVTLIAVPLLLVLLWFTGGDWVMALLVPVMIWTFIGLLLPIQINLQHPENQQITEQQTAVDASGQND